MKNKIMHVALIAIVMVSGINFMTQAAQPGGDEYETLTIYMADNNMDINKIMDRKTWIPDANAVVENLSDYFILDIREGDVAPKNGTPDFEDGHLPGAHNTTFSNVLSYAKEHNAPDNILVVSEDGMSAAAAAVALRLSGYPNTKVLKFGMSGWNSKFDVWSDKRSSVASNHDNWTKEKAEAPETFKKHPKIKTGMKSGEEILNARVEEFLANGFTTGIDPEVVLNNPDDYFVVNQGTEKDYGQYGHMKGAKQFNYPSIKENVKFSSLDNYPTDETIVQYCWTGHAGVTVSSWMNILGYDAKGLKYGVNALIYDDLQKSQFKKPAGFSYVTGK